MRGESPEKYASFIRWFSTVQESVRKSFSSKFNVDILTVLTDIDLNLLKINCDAPRSVINIIKKQRKLICKLGDKKISLERRRDILEKSASKDYGES